MKTVAHALALAQAKVFVKPSTSLTCRDFGWPQKAGGSSAAVTSGVQPRMFNWESAYSDATTPNWHGACFAGDGSLNRVLNSGNNIMRQRVASPTLTSTFTSWTDTGENLVAIAPYASPSVCIIANGAEVMIIWMGYYHTYQDEVEQWHTDYYPNYVCYLQSSDYGDTWGEVQHVAIQSAGNYATHCLSACYKSNGDIGVVTSYTDGSSNRRLNFFRRVGGSWNIVSSTYGSPTDITVDGLAVFHDGNDWNIVAQVLSGGSYYLQSIIYGDGGYVTASTWSAPQTLSLSSAQVEYEAMFKSYVDTYQSAGARELYSQLINTSLYGSGASQAVATAFLAQYPYSSEVNQFSYLQAEWINQAAVILAQAEANLGMTYPFIHQPSGQPPILTAQKSGKQYFYRLKPGTDFYEDEWERSDWQLATYTYGAALASYGNYVWMSRPNGLHRSIIPYRAWITPTAGTGAHASSESITAIVDIEETIGMSGSSLKVIIDNSGGTYDSLPTTHIAKGSRVELNLGVSTAYPTERNHYFIDDIQYMSDNSISRVVLVCVDTWTLLERYKLPGAQEYNFESDEITVMGIIEKCMTCIGGTLTDDSATTLATTTYPKVEFAAGESAASVIKKMLSLVEDTIKFRGLEGIIVNPQTTDSYTARYTGAS